MFLLHLGHDDMRFFVILYVFMPHGLMDFHLNAPAVLLKLLDLVANAFLLQLLSNIENGIKDQKLLLFALLLVLIHLLRQLPQRLVQAP